MFQIPCPMDSVIVNMTVLNATMAPVVDNNITSDDMCKPKYFIFNSQVTDWKSDAVLKIGCLTCSQAQILDPWMLPITVVNLHTCNTNTKFKIFELKPVSCRTWFWMQIHSALHGLQWHLSLFGISGSEFKTIWTCFNFLWSFYCKE